MLSNKYKKEKDPHGNSDTPVPKTKNQLIEYKTKEEFVGRAKKKNRTKPHTSTEAHKLSCRNNLTWDIMKNNKRGIGSCPKLRESKLWSSPIDFPIVSEQPNIGNKRKREIGICKWWLNVDSNGSMVQQRWERERERDERLRERKKKN